MKTCEFCKQPTNSTLYHDSHVICPDCFFRLKEDPQTMAQDMKTKRISAGLCRWTARIFGTLVTVMLLVFAIGEGVDKEFAVQVSFGGLVLVGIGNVLGWRFELTGGIITQVGVFLVSVSILIVNGLFLPGFYLVLGLPGILYLISAILRRTNPPVQIPEDASISPDRLEGDKHERLNSGEQHEHKTWIYNDKHRGSGVSSKS